MKAGGSSGSEEEEKNLKGLLKEEIENETYEGTQWLAGRLKMYNRIMTLSKEALTEEARWHYLETHSVLHNAAVPSYFPLDAIGRLCDAVGVNSKDNLGITAIAYAALYGQYDTVEYLARNKKADLSITTSRGYSVYSAVEGHPNTDEKKDTRLYIRAINVSVDGRSCKGGQRTQRG
jgi:hypothetical protein